MKKQYYDPEYDEWWDVEKLPYPVERVNVDGVKEVFLREYEEWSSDITDHIREVPDDTPEGTA